MTAPVRLGSKRPHARIGGKAEGLEWLISKGFKTPIAWTIAPGFVDGLERIIQPGKRYAVRSSANVEDGLTASFAGQFLTVLDAVGLAGVRKAIDEVRGSINSEAVRSYAAKVGDNSLITMPVIVQEMVDARASGVVFTRNPINGLNELVLECVGGRGDRLVSVGATPHRWVRRSGRWTESPTDAAMSDDVAAQIAAAASDIAATYGRAVDIEWVWDGTEVWWLQIRPITGINVGIYSDRIAREVLPGLLKPLVAAVNIPLVNRAWHEIFAEAAGKRDVRSRDLAKLFAHRAYFSMRAIGDMIELMGLPRDSRESLLGKAEGPEQPTYKPTATTLLKSPRLAAFALGRSRRNRRIEGGLDESRAGIAAFDVDLSGRSDAELLSAVDGLMDMATARTYANIVDPLLAHIYTALLPRRTKGSGEQTPDDVAEPVEADTDPNPHLDHLAATLSRHGRQSVEVAEELEEFIARFGHLSTPGNDFSLPTWGEQPELVLDIAEAGGATELGFSNPWARVSAELGTRGRLLANPLRKRAAGYDDRQGQLRSANAAERRLFRKYFLELGQRLVERDVIDEAADIMFLSLDQVRDFVGSSLGSAVVRGIVTRRRTELQAAAGITVPSVIYGEDFIAPSGGAPRSLLRGVATSRGHHRGPLRVVTGPEDFPKVAAGDVLAISTSDVGWTPLFAKAGALVAESGGMLSNASIIAREFGLPCVVGVADITQLDDDTIATVDGYRGEIALG